MLSCKRQKGSCKVSNIPKNFYITYFARKHKKFITRKGSAVSPNNNSPSKVQKDKDGTLRFIYWDLDAKPNEYGSQWRCAKNQWKIKAI